jgi:hypothetical protein
MVPALGVMLPFEKNSFLLRKKIKNQKLFPVPGNSREKIAFY